MGQGVVEWKKGNGKGGRRGFALKNTGSRNPRMTLSGSCVYKGGIRKPTCFSKSLARGELPSINCCNASYQ